MTTHGRPLALAAGTVPDLDPAAAVRCAADAGYSLAGVRLTGAHPADSVRPVAAALTATGVGLLDVEYVRLLPGPLSDAQRRVADAAGELGARHLLVVSDDPDEAATCAKLAELGELLAGSPTRPALEFMLFTAVRTPIDAVRIAHAVPGVGVVLDVLHLHRAAGPATGDAAGPAIDPAIDPAVDPAVDPAIDPAVISYAQLCDVTAAVAPADPDGLADEARHRREPPGRGLLALDRFVAALPPACPISVEVQSARLTSALGPAARAALVLDAAQTVLARARPQPPSVPTIGGGGLPPGVIPS
ncbi:sugar phosphate isomerase/epimerase family protein [Pseudonocardia parietis]|uniref:Sugar phosphate isomerase/epimerase n=1 Tax=Pseudonocardia parietis TaxID=570936 RepID=A0ABS4VZX1_9PSEU|nr:TIM barrel protein [Pseudonocardia parietis]MBP2369393.1 sugar phosphate isomerase/epimerase [Pseudonocardia parietis]